MEYLNFLDNLFSVILHIWVSEKILHPNKKLYQKKKKCELG